MYLFTYWNGGTDAPNNFPATRGTYPVQDQALNIDSVVVHANEADLGTDASGNKYIASTDVYPTFTATAVSLDQITLTWAPKAGSLIDIERSLDRATWTRVYHCPSDDGDGFGTAAAKLYNHEPSTLYYYRARYYSGAGVASAYSATTSATTFAAGTTYYVRTDGNDDTNLGTADNAGGAFASIQYAIGQMSAGDEVLIGDGTYLEASGEGASGNPSPLTVLGACLGFAAKSSGTEARPYVIRKNPNNTDRPIIDGEHVFGGNQSRKSGIHLDSTDHIHIRGLEIKNCLAYGIHTYDSGGAGATWPPAGANEGAVVDGCYIHHIGGGDNDAGVWHSANGSAVVRNTIFRDIYGNSANEREGASIYGFGMYRCLYEFNHTDKVGLTSGAGNLGISCKDYFVDSSGDSLPSVCVRYNYSDTTGAGISLWSQPGAPSGRAAFYNNLCITEGSGQAGHASFSAKGIDDSVDPPVELPVVDPIILKNNIIVCSSSNIPAIQFSNATDFQFEGNIISGTKRNALQAKRSNAKIIACDRNIYLDSFDSNLVELNRYKAPNEIFYANLAAWQAAPVTAYSSVVNPDANSYTSTTALTYNNVSTGDYTLKAGSPAIGAMADGSDAGVYQFGVENIGLYSQEPPAAPPLNVNDDFESYSLGSSPTGTTDIATWNTSGSRTEVSNVVANGGTKSLRFRYGPDAPGSDSTAEQAITLDGDGYMELWLEWDMYTPTNFTHRGEGNNKIIYLHNDYGEENGGIEYWPDRTPASLSDPANGKSYPTHVYRTSSNTPFGHYPQPNFGNIVFDPAEAGTWSRFKLHYKKSDAGLSNASVQFYKNDVLLIDRVNFDDYNPARGIRPITGIKLMGWSNSGYLNETDFYWDNLCISDTGFTTPTNVTATAVSLDQITLTWAPKAGSLIDIERSIDGVEWNRVYHCPSDDESCKLFSHEPSTLYYYRARHYSGAGVASPYSATTSATTFAAGTTYYVRKDGSDTNPGTADTAGGAFLTIQRGVSSLTAGDILNVRAGTYSDDGGAGPYSPPATVVGWLDAEPPSSNVCVNINGTAESPIIIQAAPGDEGSVVIDAQGNKLGIHLQNSDYIHIRGFRIINSRTIGVASWGQPENNVADESRLSIGVVVENNSIINTTGQAGKNTSAIGMWGTKDWIVRNNSIDGVSAEGSTLAAAMQSYGVINALIENNHIINADFGIYWKDHFIADANRTPIFESEIRYNLIESRDRGIYLGIKGTDTVESGVNYIHHNIVYGFGNSAAGIHVQLSGAFAQSSQIVIEHNTLDGEDNPSLGISVDSTDDLQITGNIILRTSLVLELVNYSGNATRRAALSESNYNVYDASGFQIYADRYSSSGGSLINNLAAWQTLVESDLVSLDVSNPDQDSITVNATSLFLSDVDDGYRLAEGSSAIGLMNDGSDAGAYQFGVENIGIYSHATVGGNVLSQGTSKAVTGLSITGAGRLGFYIDYSELSAAGTHRFYVTRTHGTEGEVGCTFTTSGDIHSTGTATLSWADGEADVKYIDVPVTSGNVSTHEGNGLGDHRVVATLSSATGGAAIHNGSGTTRAYGVINTGAIASDDNAVFYDSAAGTGEGTAADPYGSIYTAIANAGSKRYIYGKGTTIPDGTNTTSLLGDGGANCIDLPTTRDSEATRLFIQNWPGNTWTVTGNGGTSHKGFSAESRTVDYQTLRGITFTDLDCTTPEGNGCALYLAAGSSCSFISVERCTSSDIKGTTNSAMVRAQSSDNLKIWACTSDGVSIPALVSQDNAAAIALLFECKNVSVQRCKGSNSEHLAFDKRPNDGTAPALSMRFCTNGLNQRKLFSIFSGGGGTSFMWSICQNNVVVGVEPLSGNNPNASDNPIGIFTGNTRTTNDLHHWSNNTFYYSGYGERGAIDTWLNNVVAYNNLYYDARIAIHDRVNGSGNFLYLDYEQSFRPSLAEIYWKGSSSTWADVTADTAETTFADNISTADPNFVDAIDFVPQNSDALTGGVGGTERGYRLTGVEIIGPVGLQNSDVVVPGSGSTINQLPAANYIPAKQAAHLIHPRPDSETASWAKHRRHYPGIKYEVPVGVSFGSWPFFYDLTTAPAGATIGENVIAVDGELVPGDDYGVVTWDNPTEGTHNFQVTVSFQDGATPLVIEWTLEVTTTGTIFVDAVNGLDTNDGYY